MNLSIGISPCPNDTFMFEAIVHQRLRSIPFEFDFVFEDVEQLNRMALEAQLDVTKLSYHAFAKVSDQYQILDSGSALGKNCGPIIISKNPIHKTDLSQYSIAVPGEYTTANLLLKISHPEIAEKKFMLFSKIEKSVLNGDTDLGLIIHENRFTYQDKGLIKVQDLGEFWEESTGYPIPLGCIAIRRNLPAWVKAKVNASIRKSIRYAFDHPYVSMPFIQSYAQEMDEDVIREHINLYVNKYSVSLKNKGKQAVLHLLDRIEVLSDEKNITHPVFA